MAKTERRGTFHARKNSSGVQREPSSVRAVFGSDSIPRGVSISIVAARERGSDGNVTKLGHFRERGLFWRSLATKPDVTYFSREEVMPDHASRNETLQGGSGIRVRATRGLSAMLVLTRKLMEKLFIGDDICVTVVRIEGGQVRLGIEAPRNVSVVRSELVPDREPGTPLRASCPPRPIIPAPGPSTSASSSSPLEQDEERGELRIQPVLAHGIGSRRRGRSQ